MFQCKIWINQASVCCQAHGEMVTHNSARLVPCVKQILDRIHPRQQTLEDHRTPELDFCVNVVNSSCWSWHTYTDKCRPEDRNQEIHCRWWNAWYPDEKGSHLQGFEGHIVADCEPSTLLQHLINSCFFEHDQEFPQQLVFTMESEESFLHGSFNFQEVRYVNTFGPMTGIHNHLECK